MIYLEILLLLLVIQGEYYLSYIPDVFNIFISLGLILIMLTILFIIGYEIYLLPEKIKAVLVYYLKLSGEIDRGESFTKLESTIDEGDWTAASYIISLSQKDLDFSEVSRSQLGKDLELSV